jgi:hypothetical protein
MCFSIKKKNPQCAVRRNFFVHVLELYGRELQFQKSENHRLWVFGVLIKVSKYELEYVYGKGHRICNMWTHM